jgi:hypothetical protein
VSISSVESKPAIGADGSMGRDLAMGSPRLDNRAWANSERLLPRKEAQGE